MAKKLVSDRQFSIRLACACVNISESGYRYVPLLSSENALVADWLLRLTEANKQWGFGLCFLYLRNVKGFSWNHKRVYRIYRERPDALSVPLAKNQV
jgi:putative transposase